MVQPQTVPFPTLLREEAAELLKQITGFGLVAEKGAIQIKLDPDVQSGEAYRLEINEHGIFISASTSAGLFYGAATVRQLLPAHAEKDGITQAVELPHLHIEDDPTSRLHVGCFAPFFLPH